MHYASSLLLLLALVCTTALYADKPAMSTRIFKWPPDYLDRGSSWEDLDSATNGDAFSVRYRGTPPPLPPRKIVKDFLEKQGVTFTQDASATFNPLTALLTVTNSQDNLDLVEALVESYTKQSPATIACTLTVIEGPGELIRQANAAASVTANAAQTLATLLGYAKNPGSNVRVVGDAYLETKPGKKASTESVREHTYAASLDLAAKSRPSVAHEMRKVGLHLEYEPYLGPDGITISSVVSVYLHPSPARERQITVTEPVGGGTAEFPVQDIAVARFTCQITSTSGSTKFIGITKPVGASQQGADILWAAFLTTTVRRAHCPPSCEAAVVSHIAQPPAGMKAISFSVPEGLFEPLMPEAETQELWRRKLIPLQKWFEANGIPPVTGATAEYTNGILTIINTADNIERIASLTSECLSESRRTVAFTLHTIQAPAAFLRDLALKSTSSADDASMLAAIKAAVSRGEARFVDSLFVETKPGIRSTLESVSEHAYLSEFGTDAKGRPKLGFAMRPVGSILQIEPAVRANGNTVEIILNHELHGAAPEERREHFRDPASDIPFEMPAADFHSTMTATEICMMKGGTKLISLQRPTGNGDNQVLWATFLKCDLVTQIPKPPQAPIEKTDSDPADPKTWNTRSYHVPPDFTSSGGVPESRITAQIILEAAGISFPAGATVSYNLAANRLIVKNTNENLSLLDDYIGAIWKASPKSLLFTTHILQGPGPLLRRLTAQASSKSDHRAELDELLAAANTGTVQHLNTTRVESNAGTSAFSKQINEHTAFTSVSVNDKGDPLFERKMREVGFLAQLEPTVGADGITVELTLSAEFHTAPPLEHREHIIDTQGRRLEFPLTDYFTSKLTTGITIPDGTARLISLYKPTGKPEFEKEDILQAIFITCDLLRVEK